MKATFKSLFIFLFVFDVLVIDISQYKIIYKQSQILNDIIIDKNLSERLDKSNKVFIYNMLRDVRVDKYKRLYHKFNEFPCSEDIDLHFTFVTSYFIKELEHYDSILDILEMEVLYSEDKNYCDLLLNLADEIDFIIKKRLIFINLEYKKFDIIYNEPKENMEKIQSRIKKIESIVNLK